MGAAELDRFAAIPPVLAKETTHEQVRALVAGCG